MQSAWLEECLSQQRRLSEGPHLFNVGAALARHTEGKPGILPSQKVIINVMSSTSDMARFDILSKLEMPKYRKEAVLNCISAPKSMRNPPS